MNFGCRKSSQKVAIVLAQLGTPEAPTKAALRPYLKEFLSDRRVIEVNKLLWWFILNVIILNTRPKRSAKLYERIWTKEGSPLLLITKEQTEQLRQRFSHEPAISEVVFGMRYGKPALSDVVSEVIRKGCSRIILVPMYPQYSAATSGSVYDAFFPTILKERWVPSVRVVDPFFNDAMYINALAESVRSFLDREKYSPEMLLLSYHGMPKQYVEKGDPYCCMCTETTNKLKLALSDVKIKIEMTFQSRFGNDPWLTPYTDLTIEELAKNGVKKLAVACPGFAADCLETLDEIGNEAREAFIEAGGEELKLVPCLNADELFINCLEKQVRETASNWLSVDNSCSSSVCPSAVNC